MPELPEVEVTRLSFALEIAGAQVISVHMGKALRWPLGCAPTLLTGRLVQNVRRRGKYLLIDFDHGVLLVHLGMSGSLSFAPQLRPADIHDHFEMVTTRGTLRLTDPRRFGAVVYADSQDAPQARKLLGKLGVEPLSDDFDVDRFHFELKGRKASIKQVLLAGVVVVGVGNIYASEALFLAGIRPTLSASRLSRPRCARLHAAIQDVLARAVAKGGSTLRNFSSANGDSGHFQLDAMVYARQGQPCRVCSAPIKTMRQGQRSTFYCPHCQKA
ncbi:MAG: bifunctional DNA-formamidopyrimidine glycosylase/DNA-(apurinic or apyrimidinic site) lyase [Gammaproteobacteria bacterium]|uniref:bifunctional DNA-formamidopyrimidine glycosylase/DNA-(apurinic or apyrimidinic site) lyase n=1 Tax=Rhodoferax sp. TaxID=50421 RepID=UPI00180E3148|nr:bifunctional DNA-formamidopyrimidine glycosylase/DNA-(apurinic or apyrimidinic site) lyase [Rhodoferax sp.]MBU3898611.1 bifunctional DNA-formamidopyrimidine glycosylase/DNA-(apurinic or apyrimidinic site) lyase [Gammaproteobacteria bacterium]MBA3057437.1 bifunctional DNA-formamidopyrimidine glycosylase/DNA-(apurinic or apyrimidinic site) lyase [Rhodoferax sp.]MBU3997714.1 bifunctional DNA-formamidopyrimidine glycosylase/DNA-(apurinic or apyrimidinic site) lyase [Gammaproteobacteria bacterium]